MERAEQPISPRHQRAAAIGRQQPEIAEVAERPRRAVDERRPDGARADTDQLPGVEIAPHEDLREAALNAHGVEVRRLPLEGDPDAPVHGAVGQEAPEPWVVLRRGRSEDDARHQTGTPGMCALHPGARSSTALFTAPARWPSSVRRCTYAAAASW